MSQQALCRADSALYFFFFFFWLCWVLFVAHRFFADAPGLSLVVVSRGYSIVSVHELLTVVGSLVAGHRL